MVQSKKHKPTSRLDASMNEKINTRQLCKRWGTTSRNINRLIASGDLVAIDLSPTGSPKRAYVFDEACILEFEERRRTRKSESKPGIQRRKKKAEYQVFV